MATKREYIEPGTEVDCAYFPSANEYIRGFLRLPSPSETGRIRFTEDAPSLDWTGDTMLPVPVRLLDGGTGTPACLIKPFLLRHAFSVPLPSPYPLELFVNAAIVGNDDPERRYASATVRCQGLVDFFEVAELTPKDVAEGATSTQRARASSDAWTVAMYERLEVGGDATAVSMRWYGEISLHGEDRTLAEWATRLNEVLALFAVLCDRPLLPERVYTVDQWNSVDFYATWPKAAAPARTAPLVTLRLIDERFASVVENWLRLKHEASDLVDHVFDFQIHRGRYTPSDGVLLLVRCLELYHSYCERFESVVRPKAAHRKLVKAVLEALPETLAEKHQEWIKPVLSEANRKRLVAQIQDILEDLGPDVAERCSIADPLEFASVAKSTRNYYTHPTGPPPDDVPEGRDLLVLATRLWFVVRACVLVELGLPRDEVAAALKRSGERHYLLT